MPELFGVFRHDGLREADREAFKTLAAGFGALGEADTRTDVCECAALGVKTYHPNESACLTTDPQASIAAAWIGRHLENESVIEWSRDLVAGGTTQLPARDPPFAGCVVDRRSRSMRLVSDVMGFHPVHVGCYNGVIGFASKFTPLLRSGLLACQRDHAAIVDFFTFEHLTGDRTLADGIRIVPPGSLLIAKNGAYVTHTYHDPFRLVPDRMSVEARADRLYDALRGAVGRAIRGRRRVGVTLSGGLDSRALLGLAIELGADVRTFTFGLPGCRDGVYARRMAGACGVPHTFVEVDGSHVPRWLEHGVFVTGGMVSCGHFHILSLADALQSDVDVVLDGLSGDMLTGGHLKPGILRARRAESGARAIYRQLASGYANPGDRAALFSEAVRDACDHDPLQSVRRYFRDLGDQPVWVGCHRFDILERQRRFIQYGPHLLRPIVDVATPFYAPEVIETLSGAPAWHLVEQYAYHRMHRKHLPALARVPDTARNVPVSWPASVRFGRKVLDFVCRRLPAPLRPSQDAPTDYAAWLRHSLAPLRTAAFEPCAATGLFRPDALRRVLAIDGGAINVTRCMAQITAAHWGELRSPGE